MAPRLLALLAIGGTLAAPAFGGSSAARRPRLVLRASPPAAIGPIEVLVTAELVGGDEHEDFYCPEVEWTWADESRSVQGEDCPAYDPAETSIVRRYTARRLFQGEGKQTVKITLRRGSRVVAESATTVFLAGVGGSTGW
jgi:hypothetical protein